MKILKKIGITLLVIIALLVVISLFLPGKAHVEKSTVINAPLGVVYEKCYSIKGFRSWNPWDKIDTTAVIEYFGPEAGVGAGYTWKSNHKDVGTGKYTILSVSENDSVYVEMDFMENGKANATFKLAPEGNGTKISWSFDSDLGMNPIARFFGLMMEKFIGPDYEKGLANLKEMCEKAPVAAAMPEYKIEMRDMKEMNLVLLKANATNTNISQVIGESFGKLGDFAKKNNINIVGPPFCIYETQENDNYVFEAGMQVDKEVAATTDNITFRKMPAGKAVCGLYYGAYDKMWPAYDQVKNYIKTNNLEQIGNPMEMYITDPMAEKDTAKWLTEIYFFVK